MNIVKLHGQDSRPRSTNLSIGGGQESKGQFHRRSEGSECDGRVILDRQRRICKTYCRRHGGQCRSTQQLANEVPIAKTRQPLFARVIRQAITT
jgi:hypothetical protein